MGFIDEEESIRIFGRDGLEQHDLLFNSSGPSSTGSDHTGTVDQTNTFAVELFVMKLAESNFVGESVRDGCFANTREAGERHIPSFSLLENPDDLFDLFIAF